MNVPDPRVTGGLLRPIAPALDRAGIETVSGPEPLRDRAARLLWSFGVALELLVLRVTLPKDASRALLDGLLIMAGVTVIVGVLSAVPPLQWLDDRRPRPSFERTVRIGIFVAAIQVFVVSSLILRSAPDTGWTLGGFAVVMILMQCLPPWIAERWPPHALRAKIKLRRVS